MGEKKVRKDRGSPICYSDAHYIEQARARGNTNPTAEHIASMRRADELARRAAEESMGGAYRSVFQPEGFIPEGVHIPQRREPLIPGQLYRVELDDPEQFFEVHSPRHFRNQSPPRNRAGPGWQQYLEDHLSSHPIVTENGGAEIDSKGNFTHFNLGGADFSGVNPLVIEAFKGRIIDTDKNTLRMKYRGDDGEIILNAYSDDVLNELGRLQSKMQPEIELYNLRHNTAIAIPGRRPAPIQVIRQDRTGSQTDMGPHDDQEREHRRNPHTRRTHRPRD
jgi:hypothetical protein